MPPKATDERFPAARIKRIMHSDPDVGQIAKDTPPVMSAVLEKFLSELLTAAALAAPKYKVRRRAPCQRQPFATLAALCSAHAVAEVAVAGGVAGGGAVIKPAHIKAAVASDPKFDSLKDLGKGVPEPTTADAAGAAGTGAAKRPARPRKQAQPAKQQKKEPAAAVASAGGVVPAAAAPAAAAAVSSSAEAAVSRSRQQRRCRGSRCRRRGRHRHQRGDRRRESYPRRGPGPGPGRK